MTSAIRAEDLIPPPEDKDQIVAVVEGNRYYRNVDQNARYRGRYQYSRSYYHFGYRIPYDRKGHYDSPDDGIHRYHGDYLPGYGPDDRGRYNFYRPIRYSPYPASQSYDVEFEN